MQGRTTLRLLLALAGVLLPRELRADISPPNGFEWLRHRSVVVEKLDAFPEHVFVAWPCYSAARFSLEPYCILSSGQELTEGTLYALPARAVKTREWMEPSDAAPRPSGTLVFTQPKIDDAQAFFARDPRVLRPGFSLALPGGNTLPRHVGVRAAKYLVQIDRVGAAGVEARFVRARYECSDGSEVEVAWGPRQGEPPVPTCPVTDDHSELLRPGDGGVPPRGASAELPPTRSRRYLPPEARGQLLWLGLALVSVSLLAGGLLLRPRVERGAKPPLDP